VEFDRLPTYSPHLNAVERFWRVLSRPATHNRLFDHGGPAAVGP
jgi:transposase